MFHSVMPADWNNQTYASYNKMELCGFGVDWFASEANQDIFQPDMNSSELINDFQAFPTQETVELLSMSATGDIGAGLCNFTRCQPPPVLTSPFEDDMAPSNEPGSSRVTKNSWEIISNSQYQTNCVNDRKRSAFEPIFPYVTVDGIPGYSENQLPRADSTGSKPKRKRVQNARQRKEANVRERKRMDSLNQAFDSLKSKVPTVSSEKRLSRMETLRQAIEYISFLKDVLADQNTSDNMGKPSDSPSALDSIDISFTLRDLEALQTTNSLYSLDYTDSSDSGNSSS